MTGSNGRDRASTDRLYRSSAPGRSALTEPTGRRCSDEVCAARCNVAARGLRRQWLWHFSTLVPRRKTTRTALSSLRAKLSRVSGRAPTSLSIRHRCVLKIISQIWPERTPTSKPDACFDYRGDWQGGGDPQSCGNAVNDRRGKDSYATSDEFPNSARGFLDRLPKSKHRSAAFASRSATPPCQ
jgi:hypothetical protein